MEKKRLSLHPFEAGLTNRLLLSIFFAAGYLVVYYLTRDFFSSTVFAFLAFPATVITIQWGLPAGIISMAVLFVVSNFLINPAGTGGMNAFKTAYIPPVLVLLVSIFGAGYLRGLLKKNREQKSFYEIIMAHTYDSEYWIDPEGKLIYQSPSIERITGYPAEEFLKGDQDLFFNIIYPEDKAAFQRHFENETQNSEHAVTYQFRIITKNGGLKWLENISKKIFNRRGEFIGIRGSSREITERKIFEEALKESEREFRTIVSNANSAIIKYNMDGEITFFNQFAEELFEFSSDEVIGKKGIETINKSVFPEDQEKTEKMLQDILHNTKNYAYNENKNTRRDGTEYWMAWTNAPLFDNEGNKIGILCIGNDITPQKEAEQIVQQRLEEKNILLKEIHHRVKNNLQIISSILNLQEGFLQKEEDLDIFKTCENRISSMALVHDHLYHSDNIAKLDVRDYITALAGTIIDSYYIGAERLHADFDIDEVYLDIDRAIPCGLIITELITNSIKHALLSGEEKQGVLLIQVKKHEEQIRLSISDNGPGLGEEFDWRNSDSLGLKLVDALAAQLEAEVTVNSKNGLQWNLQFSTGENEQ